MLRITTLNCYICSCNDFTYYLKETKSENASSLFGKVSQNTIVQKWEHEQQREDANKWYINWYPTTIHKWGEILL